MRRIAVVVLLIAFVGGIVSAMPAGASTATVGTRVEAWYATLPSVSPPPAHTLHVGVTLGSEDSRTYLGLDLSSVPDDAEITSATLRLPIDEADSRMSDSATFSACTADPGPAVEGGSSPPAADCSKKVAAKRAGSAFTIDTTALAGSLRSSGIALVPDVAPGATWHVAFFGRGSRASGAAPITATLELADAAGAGVVAPPPAATTTTEAVVAPLFAAPGTGFAEPTPFTLPRATPRAQPTPATSGDAPATEGVLTATTSHRYADSIVFTLPLVLLALVWYFGAALTRPIDVRRDVEEVSPGGGLPARRRARLRARAVREQRASG